jgi:DNA-directed RNA polymerase subunit H (RpoH/RPB5)
MSNKSKEVQENVFNIRKTEDQIRKTLLENTVKMLSNRIYIVNGKKEKLISNNKINEIIKDLDDDTYEIKTNRESYMLKIFFIKINSINKPSTIIDFIEKYNDSPKIIVAVDYGNKAYNDLKKKYDNVEIFYQYELMMDIISFALQPKFELLTPEEMEAVKKEYNCMEKHLQKKFSNDAISKYFNLKPGDIIRSINYSVTSGQTISYSIVTRDTTN